MKVELEAREWDAEPRGWPKGRSCDMNSRVSQLPVRRIPGDHPRWRTVRDVAVFHLKLFAGGLLAVVLSPLSLAAGALDFLIGSSERRSFDAVLRLGRHLEQWINLYGTISEADPARDDLDGHLRRLEEAVRPLKQARRP